MTTFESIFAVEDAVETGWAEILGGKNVWREFSDQAKRTPGYEIKFTSTPTGQKRLWKGRKLDREWRGTLETRIVTTRFKNSDQHTALLVKARMAAFDALEQWGQVLPFHCITYFQEQPLARGHDRDAAQDFSTLHHELVISVRDDAWPTE